MPICWQGLGDESTSVNHATHDDHFSMFWCTYVTNPLLFSLDRWANTGTNTDTVQLQLQKENAFIHQLRHILSSS